MRYVAWYKKFWSKEDALDSKQVYVKVKELEAKDLEDVFYNMQGEVWSPNGEARELIRGLGLSHTSMSTGDIIENERGELYLVAGIGFERCDSFPTEIRY